MTATAEFELLPEIYRVKMGDSTTTDQITAALDLQLHGFQFNEWITQANFPLKQAKAPWEDEIQIVYPYRAFTEKDGLWFLSMSKLDRPTYEHGIRFAQQYLQQDLKMPYLRTRVIFLHKPWRGPDGAQHVVSVSLDETWPWLNLDYPREHSGFDLVAGVRRRK
jgi:hypothetical protein